MHQRHPPTPHSLLPPTLHYFQHPEINININRSVGVLLRYQKQPRNRTIMYRLSCHGRRLLHSPIPIQTTCAAAVVVVVTHHPYGSRGIGWSSNSGRGRPTNHVRRNTSTTAISEPQRLFLWLGDPNHSKEIMNVATKRTILFPPMALRQLYPTTTTTTTPAAAAAAAVTTTRNSTMTWVHTIEDIVQAVDAHYNTETSSDQFVGGMGEQDLGVWFLPIPTTHHDVQNDPFLYTDLIHAAIETVRESRHGIPFGMYTSGCMTNQNIPLTELGIDTFEVSLFGSNPKQYEQCTGRNNFHNVCAFIATAAEDGVGVEVSVLQQYATEARDLAVSLGARDVHVYE
jgi:hypothetical protein